MNDITINSRAVIDNEVWHPTGAKIIVRPYAPDLVVTDNSDILTTALVPTPVRQELECSNRLDIRWILVDDFKIGMNERIQLDKKINQLSAIVKDLKHFLNGDNYR